MIDPVNLDAFSAAVYAVWQFVTNGFDANQKLWCGGEAKEKLPEEMFLRPPKSKEHSGLIFVNPDSLPMSGNIQAVALNRKKGRILLETMILDWPKLRATIREGYSLPSSIYREDDLTIEDSALSFKFRGRILLRSKSFGAERTALWTETSLEDINIHALLQITSCIWNRNCFLQSGSTVVSSTTGAQGLLQVQEMRMELRQEPLAILRLERLLLMQRIPRAETLRMSNEEFREWVRRKTIENPFLVYE
jgi:hypothetical protein